MIREKTIGIIIARLTSSRLPGKALLMLNGKPLIGYTLERLRAVHGLDEIWLATTLHPADQPLLLWGIQEGLHVLGYPGDINDVVGRLSLVLERSKADRFISVLGDCPFVDSRLMNRMMDEMDTHPEWEAVFVDHLEKESVHRGIGCFRTSGWRKIDAASQEPKYREHLASILTQDQSLITKGLIQDDPLYYEGDYRLTIDTQADFAFFKAILDGIKQPEGIISLETVLNFLKNHPELSEINHHVRQKNIDDEPLNVLIALQAGGNYGKGHLMRCLTLARFIEEHFSGGVTFWVDSPHEQTKREMAAEGCNVVEGNWSLAETVRQGKYNRLLIDFQSPLTPSIVSGVRLANPDIPIIVLDNNGLGCAEADAVVFPNAHAVPSPDWQPETKKVYSGAAYVVLGSGFLYGKHTDDQFQPLERPTILVTMGSRDPDQITEKLLNVFKELSGCHFDLIVPPMYERPERIEQVATKMNSTVTLHWRIKNLRAIMQRATLAIAGFGVTSYELAYLGVPTLLMGHYDSQLEDMERFAKWGSAISVGSGKTFDPDRLFTLVTDLIDDAPRRQMMSEKGKHLVDAIGPLRVAEVIVATVREPMPVSYKV